MLQILKSKGIQYTFQAKPWQHTAAGGWYFVSLPGALAKEIRVLLKEEEKGWGRLPVTAKVGNTEWKTAIWFDTKRNTYLMPLKVEIRKKENLTTQTMVQVALWI